MSRSPKVAIVVPFAAVRKEDGERERSSRLAGYTETSAPPSTRKKRRRALRSVGDGGNGWKDAGNYWRFPALEFPEAEVDDDGGRAEDDGGLEEAGRCRMTLFMQEMRGSEHLSLIHI